MRAGCDLSLGLLENLKAACSSINWNVRLWLLKYDHETDDDVFLVFIGMKLQIGAAKHQIQAAWSLTQIIPGVSWDIFPQQMFAKMPSNHSLQVKK